MNALNKTQRFLATVGFFGIFAVTSAQASVDLAKVPLQTGSSVPPNIMFVLDDSGSMQFELTPGELTGGNIYYMFPRADRIYGGSDYTHYVATADGDDHAYGARTRSHEFNSSYYNPSVTYVPWIRADGTYFPNANPECAWHNPMRTGNCPSSSRYYSTNDNARNLTVRNWEDYNGARWVTCNSNYYCYLDNVDYYWPATYYHYNGGNSWNANNFTRVRITSSQSTYSGHGRQNRSDCVNGTCTYEQEIQNFANWYTYYRSRVLAARAGIGRAFVNQSEKMRVGFGTINKGGSWVDGDWTDVIVQGVRQFEGNDKEAFYQQLYGRDIPAAGTPLRNALNTVGRYYSRSDSRGPWGLNPGSGDERSEDHITCRQSFTILMTDGYWSGSTPSNVSNEDGQNGSWIYRPEGEDGDSYRYTASDPFRDGRSDTLADVAMKYWKNDLRDDLDNRVPTTTINPAFWQHMVTFGVGFGVFGDVDPDDAFSAINSGVDIDWPNPFYSDSAKLDDLLHASINSRGGYFTASNPELFASRLERTLTSILDRVGSATNLAGTTTSTQAENYVYQGSFNSGAWSGALKSFDITNPSIAVWESNFPSWQTRRIVFGQNNGTAAYFTPANVNADGNALAGNADLVNYLRGDRSYETGASAKFRARVSVMGDIANSSPLYVANSENRSYERYDWAGSSSYRSFVESTGDRTPLIFVGANDGLFHAFNANTGAEEFAYIPAQILDADTDIAAYSDLEYEHNYYVDGSASLADVYIDNEWKSLVIGSLGRGGSSLFAIDVTSTDSTITSPTSHVLWDQHFDDLGVTVNKPLVVRLNNNKWAVVVGYGYNGDSGKAGLLVIDIEDGSIIKSIETDSATNNGMGRVEAFDYDADGNHDWFFAGDLHGNVWKFDLSSSNTADWDVAYGGDPLYVARDSAGNRQAITGGVTLSSHTETGKLWVFFGTGRMLSEDDPVSSASNTWYGIKDGPAFTGRYDLLERDIIYVEDDARVIERGSRQELFSRRGWYIELDEPRERIVNTAQILGETLVINTIIPSVSECNPQGSGWVLAVDPFSGGRLAYNFFDRNSDNVVDSDDSLTVPGENGEEDQTSPVSGIRFDGMPSEPVFFEDRMVVGLSDTRIATVAIDANLRRGRISWREITNQ